MWRRKPTDADLADEFQAHLDIETRQLMDRGLSREQAEAQARRLFGNRTLILETTREARGRPGFARLAQDLRYAARVLRRAPAFTAAAVLSLSLGIGATTAVFSIADTVFLRPLPYADADRLVWVAITFGDLAFVPSPDYVAWRRDNHVFQSLAATQASLSSSMYLGGSEPAELHAARVSANFLDAFAIAPALGRNFTAGEEFPNGPKAVLLTHHLWRDRFHARRDIVGSSITLDSEPYTVAGVLPPSFVLAADVPIDLLATLSVSPTAGHRDRSMSTWAVFGRLKPGVSIAQARADLEALFAAAKSDFPPLFKGSRLVLQPLQQHRAGNVRTLLFVLMGAAGCLLLIACANVANLLLARWSARSHELALRAAIGAGRGRLARQMFTEIALLLALGTAGAMLFVTAALRGFVHFAAGELPRLGEVGADFRVFALALLISVATALLFSALPILRAGRIDIQSVLQQARTGLTGRRQLLRRVLVAAELALSVVLLSGAALLFQTLWHMENDQLGFRPEHVFTVRFPVRGPIARDTVAADVIDFLRRIPGTETVARVQCTPLTGGVMSTTFSRSDRPLPEPFHHGDSINVCGVDPGYLQAAGTRLISGRFFTDDDFHHPGAVAVINEAAARAYFSGESPIGKQILGGRVGAWKTVVGVIADTRNQGLNHPALPQALVNDTTGPSDPLFLVRTLSSEAALSRALHDQMRTAWPGLFTKIQSLDDAIGESSASPRFNTVLLSAFASVALLMAIVGVYGVLAFSVAERRQEIGIRMALGASPRAVLSLVLKEGAALITAGALAGVLAALLLTRYLATLLYGVTPTDPATYAAVVFSLALFAAAASFLPARRAAALHPMAALRHD